MLKAPRLTQSEPLLKQKEAGGVQREARGPNRFELKTRTFGTTEATADSTILSAQKEVQTNSYVKVTGVSVWAENIAIITIFYTTPWFGLFKHGQDGFMLLTP